ncbi:MAG: GreA/GreB family elongation factor [Brevundimonas sp.]|uniref:GreA/GreB family elongation factor n=1 Tax=Brevundimonas sp. TaxID=1871086 RepID=UPI00391A0EDF
MTATAPRRRLPPVAFTASDIEIIEGLLASGAPTPARSLLEAELSRAAVVSDAAARGAARLGDWVEYRTDDDGPVRRVQLVLPAAADIDQKRVSVLSPVGAALIGLKAGARFEWTDTRGRRHRLQLLSVSGEGEDR